MNLEGLKSHPDIAALRSDRFRVADVLPKQHSEGRWELFVTHPYFTEVYAVGCGLKDGDAAQAPAADRHPPTAAPAAPPDPER